MDLPIKYNANITEIEGKTDINGVENNIPNVT